MSIKIVWKKNEHCSQNKNGNVYKDKIVKECIKHNYENQFKLLIFMHHKFDSKVDERIILG